MLYPKANPKARSSFPRRQLDSVAKQRLQREGRPRLVAVQIRQQFLDGVKAGFQHVVFVREDLGFGHVHQVHDAEVDFAHFGEGVVDQSDDLLAQNKINRSSIVFSLPQAQEVGSLSKVLTILAFYGINLSKIQSNPVVGHEWEYLFYIDLSFNNYTRYIQALDAARPLCGKLVVLGEYENGRQSDED